MAGFTEWLDSPAGPLARISCKLGFKDRLGACKARWGIGRMDFIVPPGLYAIGLPTAQSAVVVTANYKMSYDHVRRALDGRNCWLLVLETYGINVWCAAGKGTFGTGELVRRVTSSGLSKVVSHRRLILPILGAAGVSAHQVAQRCGFTVSYATIRAADLPEYLNNGQKSTPAMRRLTFNLYERLVLIPVELVLAAKSIGVIGVVALLLAMLTGNATAGVTAFGAYVGAVLSGIVIGPLLLPWLPTRSFAVKGAVAGLILCAVCLLLVHGAGWSWPVSLAMSLAIPAISSFYTLNFTGCTPYTSRSGVKKEMRIALPLMAAALLTSLGLLAWARFV